MGSVGVPAGMQAAIVHLAWVGSLWARGAPGRGLALADRLAAQSVASQLQCTCNAMPAEQPCRLPSTTAQAAYVQLSEAMRDRSAMRTQLAQVGGQPFWGLRPLFCSTVLLCLVVCWQCTHPFQSQQSYGWHAC